MHQQISICFVNCKQCNLFGACMCPYFLIWHNAPTDLPRAPTDHIYRQIQTNPPCPFPWPLSPHLTEIDHNHDSYPNNSTWSPYWPNSFPQQQIVVYTSHTEILHPKYPSPNFLHFFYPSFHPQLFPSFSLPKSTPIHRHHRASRTKAPPLPAGWAMTFPTPGGQAWRIRDFEA